MLHNILVIEDDADIAESLHYNFKREGYRVTVAESAEKGLRLALDEKQTPSLILLDLMLPGMSGMELCRRLRRETVTEETPIIMLTAKAAEADKIAGLDLGADDYIVKPFSVKEVIARVRAVLRRSEKESSPRYEDARIVVDFDDMRVVCDGEDVKLTRKEFALLEHLIKNIGRVATRQQLLDNVWGYSYFGDTRTLDVHIRRLRQKMAECGNSIETVVGVGYRFIGGK
jgi:two-component system, OmpR family, alkaline phosphatase synthesis response regulator PhoP